LLTLAIGIGVNTAVFSAINGVLIKPLPYPRADELVGIWHSAPGVGLDNANISPTMYFTYRACCLPARRASSLSPVEALRAE
jgi:hypothetical protein